MSKQQLMAPTAAAVRVRQSLAERLAVRNMAEPEVPTVGVYSLQLATWHKNVKGSLGIGALEKLKRNCDRPEQEEDCDIIELPAKPQVPEAPRSPSPPPAPVLLQKKQKPLTKSQKLLQEIEEAQLCFLSQKAMEKLKKSQHMDSSSDIEDLNSDDCICEEQEQELERMRTITVKVMRLNEITKFTMLKKENFSKIISQLAKMNSVEEVQVLLTLNDRTIKSYDTPISIGLSIADIMEYSILSKSAETMELPDLSQNGYVINLRVQSKTSKKKVDISINKNDPMSKLIEKFAKHSGIDASRMLLKFDGDEIKPDSTPEELDLEDGYCIDVYQT